MWARARALLPKSAIAWLILAAAGVRATMAALDKSAPTQAVEKTLRYGELFKDGLLDFTVGVGYDEDGMFDSEIVAIKNELQSTLGLNPGSAGDAKKMYEKAGMTMPASGGGDYYIKEAALTHNNQPINVLVRLVTYKDPEAKKAFTAAAAANAKSKDVAGLWSNMAG